MVYDTVWYYYLQQNRRYRYRFQYYSGYTQDGVYYTRQNWGRSLYYTVCQRTERSTAKLWGVSGRNGKCMYISAVQQSTCSAQNVKKIKSKLFVQSCPSQEILNQYSDKEYNILTTFRCCCLFFFSLLVNVEWSTDSLIVAGSLLNTKKTDGSLTLELSAKYVTTRTNRKIT